MLKINSIQLRKRKSRVHLPNLVLNESDKIPSRVYPVQKKPTHTALQFLWKEKLISLEEYLTACRYAELLRVIRKISGAPLVPASSFKLNAFLNTSRVTWIQAELSFLNGDVLKRCTDEDLLKLWKGIRRRMEEISRPLREMFENIINLDQPPMFRSQLRLYIKSIHTLIPIVKEGMANF